MGVRPPSNDADDEPDSVEFGIVALDGQVEQRNISFPISAADLNDAHGDIQLAVDPSGHETTLAEALAECDQQSFESKQELLNALHPIFERKREKLSGGILGRLRALVPF